MEVGQVEACRGEAPGQQERQGRRLGTRLPCKKAPAMRKVNSAPMDNHLAEIEEISARMAERVAANDIDREARDELIVIA